MASKPSRILDWINDDSASKYTTPSGAQQLAGHQDATNADAKVFNWAWWRCSQWIEFLDDTFDANGKDINAPKSTTITETISPTASCVTLDSGGIKSWDGSSNAIFSVTEAGAVSLGYSGNDVISLAAGVISVCTASSADLIKLHAVTASAADLNILNGSQVAGVVNADINLLAGQAAGGLTSADLTKLSNIDASDAEIDQLDGVTVGGSASGDIVTVGGTQTLTNKTLTTPKINEAVNLTSTSTELNQLDGVSVGGSSSGDIVTIDDTQTLTNKTIGFSQIAGGTAPATRQYLLTGHDTTPAAIVYQGTTRYTKMSCNTAGTTMSVNPSTTNTVALNIGTSSYRYSSIGIYASAGGATIDTGSGGITLTTSGNIVATAGDDNSAQIVGGLDSAGNNYCSFLANGSDNGTGLISVRENTTVESYTFAPTNFRSSGNADLGLTGSRWGTGYFQNLNITSISGDAITVNDSASDGIQVVDWAASNAGLKLSIPSLSTTRGQICLNSTSNAIATKYSNASGGELAAYNNGGTIELWWHDGSSWAKIS